MANDDANRPFYKNSLFWACIVSGTLLSFFLWLHATRPSLINLPVQWIWVSLLPILLALIVGGYISKLKLPGVEYEGGPRIPENVQYVSPSPPGRVAAKSGVATGGPTAWTDERDKEYQRTSNLFLVHVCKPSTRAGQRYDVTIFLMRHITGREPNQTEGFEDVEKAEFYFGESWGNQVITAHNEGSFVGVSTSAWGMFLATCRVTFRDRKKTPVILYRYVDFEMAPRRV